MTTEMLTYVSSHGIHPLSGEVFPEGYPKYRSLHEVHELLKLGFEVEQREDDLRIPLNLSSFEARYSKYLTTEKPVVNNQNPKRK